MNMTINYSRLLDVERFGQSIWLDELRRSLLGKELTRLVTDDGVSGLTSNPSIVAKAIGDDRAYAARIDELRKSGLSGERIYERLTCDDVRAAAEQLRRVYDQSDARDGYVSIEVPPAYAHDAEATVNEAYRLREAIDLPNIMIKVPATDAGLVALHRLVAAGVNVNATLIFGTRRYRQVADAYMQGLEERAAAGKPLERIASVASLFISRIDTLVDKQLDAIGNPDKAARARTLRGKAAIAVARIAYQDFKKTVASHRWQALAARHGQPQRLLWASTSTKDARYSDVKYVDHLIGPDTVNTLPLATLNAFRDHGAAAPVLEHQLLEMVETAADLLALGIDLDQVAAQLEREGLSAFAASMGQMLAAFGRPQSYAIK